MSRPPNAVPVYRKHPTKDEARAWTAGQWVYLGKWNSAESKQAYERLCAEVRAALEDGRPIRSPAKQVVSVNEVVVAFSRWAVEHYRRPDGQHTSEVRSFRDALRSVCELYGDSPAREFGPLALKAVRQRFVDRGWCRGVVNKQVGRVKRVFKWATAEELLGEEVYRALCTVEGLQRGRCKVRETEEVLPVAREHVAATLPYLSRHVRAMVELQLLTGMRPGEVCGLTLGEIDRGEGGDGGGEGSGRGKESGLCLWVYRPQQHKTRHHDRERVIPFGPKAKSLVMAFLGERVVEPTENIFSPQRSREEAYAVMRAKRKTRVQPSQVSRRKETPKRLPRTSYTNEAYAHAVERGVERANRELIEAGVEVERHIPHWHPNQLRHTHGTLVRKLYGLEAAGAVLGHSKMSATEVYAERDAKLALRIAEEIG